MNDPTPPAKSSADGSSSAQRSAFNRWRAACIFLLLVLAFLVASAQSYYTMCNAQLAHTQQQLTQLPQVKYIAVLNDDKAQPGLLVTLAQTEHELALQRLSDIAEGQEDSMQLWAVPAQGKPRSLGLLAPKIKTLRIPGDEAQLAGVSRLAISVEAKGGVSDEQGPRLPWLFVGSLVQKAL